MSGEGLAVKGKALGRKLLGEVASIVTPDTILAWQRVGIEREDSLDLCCAWRISNSLLTGRSRNLILKIRWTNTPASNSLIWLTASSISLNPE